MRKFWIQIKNDVRLNKNSLLNPLILFLILDVLAIIFFFILKRETGFTFADLWAEKIELEFDFNKAGSVVWSLLSMFSLGPGGFVMILVSMSISNNALNLETKEKCEIFYRSQPVSVWQYAGSKYLVSILGPLIILLITAVMNIILLVPVVSMFVKFQFVPLLEGFFFMLLYYFRSMLILGGLGFLASAIFKEKAYLKVFLIILGIQLTLYLAHFILGIQQVDIFDYIFRFIEPLYNYEKSAAFIPETQISDFYYLIDIKAMLFNWHSFWQIVVSGLLFLGGVFIYREREVL